tara:strand:- start:592 stop:1029 length:438 start_codon:yes stop_codon:yes gene_type:complete
LSRPIYETEGDRLNESFLKTKLEKIWNCKLIKLPKKSMLDFCAERDKEIVAFIEMKHRSKPSGSYPTYMLSLAKLQAAKRLHQDTGKLCLLVVQWTDLLEMVDLAKCDFRIAMGGRTDRGDSQDIEPVAHIPFSGFGLVGSDGKT